MIEVPGYLFQALVASPPASEPPLSVWRGYNGRADCENVIKELQQGFALTTPRQCWFWVTELPLSLAALTYNLAMLFQPLRLADQADCIHPALPSVYDSGHPRRSGGKNYDQTRISAQRMRVAAPAFGKLVSLFPNYNAVENIPAF
jgi:hypothetical protein